MSFNWVPIVTKIFVSLLRLSNLQQMITRLKRIEKFLRCKWFIYVPFSSSYTLTVQIRTFNLWIKSVFIKRYINFFWDNFSPNLRKLTSLKFESFYLQYHFIHSIIWNRHIWLARCENLILWNNFVFIREKLFLIDHWLFLRKVFSLLTLHIQFLTMFHPQVLSRIHSFEKFLTIHWITKPRKQIKILLRNTNTMLK